MVKLVIKFLSVFLLIILTCNKASAEPMELSPSKDDVNKIIAQINRSKPDKNLVNNLLIIARYYLYEDDKESEKYSTRALSLSKELSYNEGVIKSMCLQAAFLNNVKSDSISAIQMVDKAILLSRKQKLPEMEAYAYYTKAFWFKWINPSFSNNTEKYCIKSRNLYKRSNNKINEAYMLKCLADIHNDQKKPGQSLEELFEVVQLYKSAGHPSLHYTYHLIALIYNDLGNYEQALKYSLLAIKSAEKTNDFADITHFYFQAAHVYMALDQPKNALPYFSFILNKEDKVAKSFFIQRATASYIASILVKTGKPEEALNLYKKMMHEYPVKQGNLKYSTDELYLGNIYFSLKQYDKAEKLFLHMLEHNEKDSRADYFNLMCYLKLGNFYIAQGKFAKASKYIDKAVTQKSSKSILNNIDLNVQQFKVDSASGNYLSAIRHYQIYKSLNDSLFNEKKSKQVSNLNIQFETEKKQQKIGILTAKNKTQQAILEKRVFERNVFTAGAIMLLLLLLLSVNRYKIKQKSNRKLKEQQEIINKKNEMLNGLLEEKEGLLQSKDKLIAEKEWLIKEVHHRVKNNLQMIATLLYSQATYLKDTAAIAAINESQQRIYAISLIHQKLYQSHSLQLVNMKNYVNELVDYLKDSFDSAEEIDFNLDLDSFEMGITKAIPLGLILNEAITNSIKYAFSKDSKKIISICLHHTNNRISLQIKDNGKGLPADFNTEESDSLGINLMQGLSNQINADFSMRSENGTIISMEFDDMGEPLLEQVM